MPEFSVLPLQTFADARLSARDLRVLGILYAHDNGSGIVFPARKTIANLAGLTERKVSASTARLVEFGWIAKRGGGHRGKATEYQLRVPVKGTLSAGKDAGIGHPMRRKGCPQTTEKGASRGQPEVSREVIKHTGSDDEPTNGAPLPSWLPPGLWAEFRAHRKALRAPMTDEAERRNLAKLGRLRDDGQDPDAVIGQSVENGWRGLFPVRPNGIRGNGAEPPPARRPLE